MTTVGLEASSQSRTFGWRRVALVVTILFALNAPRARGTEPPEEWRYVLSDEAQAVWDSCHDGSHFQATRLIGLFRTLGSQSDGDRQFDVAKMLSVAPDDPHEALLYYLHSPDPYDRAFVIEVIGLLGDHRFTADLLSLTDDPASTQLWSMLTYDSVGGAARQALGRLQRGSFAVANGIPPWLAAARRPTLGTRFVTAVDRFSKSARIGKDPKLAAGARGLPLHMAFLPLSWMTVHSLSLTGLAILQLVPVFIVTIWTYRALRRWKQGVALAGLLAAMVYCGGCLATNSIYLWMLFPRP